MRYKLVAMDVDGTLTDSTGKIPKENVNAIRMLCEKGVTFVISTGRNDIEIARLAHEIGIEPLIIGCNGATVRNLNTQKTFVYEHIESEPLKQLFAIAQEDKLSMRLASTDYMYLAFPEHDIFKHSQQTRRASTYERTMLTENAVNVIDDFEHLAELEDKIIKAVIINEAERVFAFREKAIKIPGLAGFRSSPRCLDIVNENVSKGTALNMLAAQLGIKQSEVIAIGDGENDIPMLEFAGMAIVMENAEDSVKDAANFITKSHNDAGLAYALHEVFNTNLNSV